MRSYNNSRLGVFFLLVLSLTGCVRSKVYRQKTSVLTVPPVPFPLPDPEHSQLSIGSNCGEGENGDPDPILKPFRDKEGTLVSPPGRPCLAYVEFDEQGRTAVVANGVSTQLEAAKELVRRAIRADPQGQPVIVTFIHGWKHNASPGPPEDSNIQGLEEVLDRLHRFYYAGTNSPLTCTEGVTCSAAAGHVVIGLYFSWRGESVSEYWPVARTFSVYNRRNAAKAIGNQQAIGHGENLADALNEISEIAHPPGSGNVITQPFLVFVGHSFGAKVLEGAMKVNFPKWLNKRASDPEPGSVPTLADLTILINSANEASDAREMLDLMATKKATYTQDDVNIPLILSISTTADAATGFLFPVEAAPRTLVDKLIGTGGGFPALTCFDRRASEQTWHDTSHIERDYQNHTAPHLDSLQSHVTLDFPPLATASYGLAAQRPCSAPSGGSDINYEVPGHCFMITRPKLQPNGSRVCNHTPYFIFETGRDIIPDHGTIFTGRFVELIGKFLPKAPGGLIKFPVFQTASDPPRKPSPRYTP